MGFMTVILLSYLFYLLNLMATHLSARQLWRLTTSRYMYIFYISGFSEALRDALSWWRFKWLSPEAVLWSKIVSLLLKVKQCDHTLTHHSVSEPISAFPIILCYNTEESWDIFFPSIFSKWSRVFLDELRKCLFYKTNQDPSTVSDFSHHYLIASQKPLNMRCHRSSNLGNFGKHGHIETTQPGASSRLFGNCFGEDHPLVNAVEDTLFIIHI